MARRRRLPSRRRSGTGSTLATVVVMTALLVVLITTQRAISTRLSDVFTEVTEGSAETVSAPRPAMVRVVSDDPMIALELARSTVRRASASAARATEIGR